MAQFDLKRDWPIAAAAVLGLIGLVLLTRRRQDENVPLLVGGTTEADVAGYQAALEATSAIEQARLAGATSAVASLAGVEAERIRSESAVQIENVRAETARTQAGLQLSAVQAAAAAQTEAVRIQAAAASQQAQYSLMGAIVSGILGLFCWEMTGRAESSQRQLNTLSAGAY